MVETKSLAQVIGSNARRLRTECGATMEEVAYKARDYGLRWTSGKVGNLESGIVSPSFPTIFVLCLAFSDLCDRDITVADVIGGETGNVAVNDALTVPGEALTRAGNGEPVTRMTDFNVEVLRRARAMKVVDDMKVVLPEELSMLDVHRAVAQVGVTEQRAAKDLGVDPDRLAVYCLILWRRTFAEERELRAGQNANAQKRGQAARALKDELRQRITQDGND